MLTAYPPHWLMPQHLDRVYALEQRGCQFPMSEEDLEGLLSQPKTLGVVFLSEHVPDLDAYAIYKSTHRGVTIERVVVDPHMRGQGLGREILREAHRMGSRNPDIPKSRPGDLAPLRAVVYEGNLQAQLFLRACGMRCCKILHDHFDRGEDGYLFLSHVKKPSLQHQDAACTGR